MTPKPHLLTDALRWCLAAGASAVGLACGVYFGVVCFGVVENLSPPDAMSLGPSEAPLYSLALDILPPLTAALSAVLVVLFAALSYPARSTAVAKGAFMGGSAGLLTLVWPLEGGDQLRPLLEFTLPALLAGAATVAVVCRRANS